MERTKEGLPEDFEITDGELARFADWAERMELQQRLTVAGFSTAGVDGRIGPRTLNAIKAYQRAQGRVADGFASTELLDLLRAAQVQFARP